MKPAQDPKLSDISYTFNAASHASHKAKHKSKTHNKQDTREVHKPSTKPVCECTLRQGLSSSAPHTHHLRGSSHAASLFWAEIHLSEVVRHGRGTVESDGLLQNSSPLKGEEFLGIGPVLGLTSLGSWPSSAGSSDDSPGSSRLSWLSGLSVPGAPSLCGHLLYLA